LADFQYIVLYVLEEHIKNTKTQIKN